MRLKILCAVDRMLYKFVCLYRKTSSLVKFVRFPNVLQIINHLHSWKLNYLSLLKIDAILCISLLTICGIFTSIHQFYISLMMCPLKFGNLLQIIWL